MASGKSWDKFNAVIYEWYDGFTASCLIAEGGFITYILRVNKSSTLVIKIGFGVMGRVIVNEERKFFKTDFVSKRFAGKSSEIFGIIKLNTVKLEIFTEKKYQSLVVLFSGTLSGMALSPIPFNLKNWGATQSFRII